MDLGNYIQDRNRFNLPAPPDWWLKLLFDFDADLVVIPSRQESVYRLARRARHSPGIDPLAILDRSNDTAMLASYNLVPVTSIIGWGVWGTNIFNALRLRDIWRAGGPEKAIKSLEEMEAAERAKAKADVRDDMWQRSGDAWRSYQARTGQRSKLSSVKETTRSKQSPSPSGSTAGSGVIIASA